MRLSQTVASYEKSKACQAITFQKLTSHKDPLPLCLPSWNCPLPALINFNPLDQENIKNKKIQQVCP